MSNPSFIHDKALVESNVKIGQATRVWAFVHILAGAIVGEDCNICDGVFVEGNVRIGNRVTVKCGVQLWNGVILEDDVFIGPNVTFTNDLFPRSRQHLTEPLRTVIHKSASIGANATILPGLVVGMNAVVGAGAVVTRNVPPNAIVVGNPARIMGYVSTLAHRVAAQKNVSEVTTLSAQGVRIILLPRIIDLRGSLSFGEYSQHVPFVPHRYFVVFDVPSTEVRGEHAHKEQHQFLVCLKGSCNVVVDDGINRDEVGLNQPEIGLHVPPMIWATQYKYSPDATLLVLASGVYDANDYIRDYDRFLLAVKSI
ncbi:MAG: WxcM-like domain-containing protein [Actinomycetota bacterium]